MTKGPATEGALGDLHSKVAEVMTNALRNIETAQMNWANTPVTDSDDELVMPHDPPEVNPALLSVMVRFLDSNKITCTTADSGALSDLERQLEEKRKRRGLKVVGGISHRDDDE